MRLTLLDTVPGKDVFLFFHRIFLPSGFDRHREVSKEIRRIASQPYPRANAQLHQLDERLQAEPRGTILEDLLYPNTWLPLILTRAGAHQRLISAALAVATYRAEHDGRLPIDLQSLVPEHLREVPIDPFDGKPLRTVSEPGSLVIYSVGTDAEDDGGREDYEDEDRPAGRSAGER